MIEFLLGFLLFLFISGLIFRLILWPIFKWFVYLALVSKGLIATPEEKTKDETHWVQATVKTIGITAGHNYLLSDIINKPTPEGDIQYYRIQNDLGQIQDVPIDCFL